MIVRDHRRRDFADKARILALPSFRLATKPDFFQRDIELLFPNAELVFVDSPRPFLRGELEDVDAMLFSAEMASAWTLVYPAFSVVVPRGLAGQVPNGFAVSRSNIAFLTFLNNWLDINLSIGVIDGLFNHWILGEIPGQRPPRWSIVRDVLGWVD